MEKNNVGSKGAQVTKDTIVGDLLETRPELLNLFLGYGFTHLADPIARITRARIVSIEVACEIHGIDLDEFLAALKRAADANL